MNKFKKILLGVASVLTLGALFAVTGVKVNAADSTVFTANDGTDGIEVAKNTNFINDSILQIQAKGAKASYGTSYALGDYDLGLWFSNNTTSSKGFMFTNTSTTDSIELTVTFGAFNSSTPVSVSSYFTTDESNTINTSTTSPVSLTTNLEAGASSFLVTTGRQTSLYEVSYSTGAVYHDVTINDNDSEISKSIKDGEYLAALDDMYGYAFGGYFYDEEFESSFDYENESISDDLVLYAKWISNGYFTNDYKLTTSCIHPFATEVGSSTAIASDIKLNHIFTVLSGCKGYTSGDGAIATNGGVSETQKGIKIDLTHISSGTLKVNIACGGNSKRSVKLIDSSKNAVVASSGNVDWPSESDDWYTARDIEYPIDNPGVYYLGGDNGMRVFSVEFVETKPMNDNTTASVFAEKNTSGDTLRFVGTLSGITNLDNVTSVELILKKDGVASKKQIFLTTCYTSVSGSSQACEASDGTYYVIYRLKGITGIEGKMSKQLKITFADGSTTLSDEVEFDL